MSEYIIDGTLLTNIANGIRKVDGTTAKLTPAQMQEKLTIIKTSVDGALNQVKNKGVTVPSGSDVHDLWNLIGSIELGGGLPEGVSAIATGVYIPASDVIEGEIEHGLDVVPDFFFMKCTPIVHYMKYMIVGYASYDKYCLGHGYYRGSYYFGGVYYYDSRFTSSTVTVNAPDVLNETIKYTSHFAKGAEYHWIAGVYA